MQPIIIYRAKTKKSNEWVKGHLFYSYPHKEWCIQKEIINYHVQLDNDFNFVIINPDTVGMFWRTVNKVDLFTGDIFSLDGDFPKLVRFINGQFRIANLCDLKHNKLLSIWQIPADGWFDGRLGRIQIDGNEFENPELVKDLEG